VDNLYASEYRVKIVLLTVGAIIEAKRCIWVILRIDQLELIVLSRVTPLRLAGFWQPIYTSVGTDRTRDDSLNATTDRDVLTFHQLPWHSKLCSGSQYSYFDRPILVMAMTDMTELQRSFLHAYTTKNFVAFTLLEQCKLHLPSPTLVFVATPCHNVLLVDEQFEHKERIIDWRLDEVG
jgi:hypothetical protein